MRYRKPNLLCYRVAQVVSFAVAKLIFKRRIIRNEIKGLKGPFVVIANHQAAYDFVNLINTTSRRMSFVISNSFYETLPIKKILDKIGVIPKQQFQTTVKDMRDMKAVIDSGNPLVIYPAGLMCEDGLSTPIPSATYKFLKWLGADVYVARSFGTYFVMPKWSKGMRAGNTHLDIYKLFSKEELKNSSEAKIKEKAEKALLFDAYREQEEIKALYKNGANIEGLENVLYFCPVCKKEFTIEVKNKNTIYCTHCGFEQQSDKYSFMHLAGSVGKEIRYVSDWSRLIYNDLKEKLIRTPNTVLEAQTVIEMINPEKHRFEKVGEGNITLTKAGFTLRGEISGEKTEIFTSINQIPTLPFSPGNYFEIQNGDIIYRLRLKDAKLIMKFINTVKAFYEIKTKETVKLHEREL
ncbi:MAG: 1-acyl-sn-glycerol-3-phosphate acyltransferase [Ruminococcaceae bacterium]|nr:1-acyl-sn-glycerol-3-phosphate acyltransferase [Oscillospiraceae bacterium]